MQRSRGRGVFLLGLLLAFACWMGSSQVVAQPADVSERVVRAFERGDALVLLGGDATSHLEVGLMGENRLYSRSQAAYVLQKFFKTHPPARFELQDTSRVGGNRFVAGRYFSRSDAEPLRVYVRFREREGQWELREIHIDRRRH